MKLMLTINVLFRTTVFGFMAKDTREHTRFVVKAHERASKRHSMASLAIMQTGGSKGADESVTIDRITVEINGKDQVIMDGQDECLGLFKRGEIA